MNRFRNKKKVKDDETSSFLGFRKGKKVTEEEPRKEFDLSSALPSNDNFRTSLLMNNLSARFSMLREQDDPNTKIGKARDDSVLYPKRNSRKLVDHGLGGGLRDIAEVESLNALRFGRSDSFASDMDSTRGAVMGRAKPTEGNNLFGGRQKIYKIPAGAGSMMGRVLYDDDVAMSSFQRWKLEEKRRYSLSDETKPDKMPSEEGDLVRPESPPKMGYNNRRETSSSTSSVSGVARNSTAATSIASQQNSSTKDGQLGSTILPSTSSVPAVERTATRTRRLYEQALKQDIQDQQTSSLTRINTLAGQRPYGSRTPDAGTYSPSPTSFAWELHGERRTILAKGSSPSLKTASPIASPLLSASATSAASLSIILPGQTDGNGVLTTSPTLSSPVSESSNRFVLPIQPNDHGKATAMGVFRKPARPYDESKFAERQRQLQQGRETPSQMMRPNSPSPGPDRHPSVAASQKEDAPAESRAGAVQGVESADGGNENRGVAANLEPPASGDHPALRRSPLSHPLGIMGLTDTSGSTTDESNVLSSPGKQESDRSSTLVPDLKLAPESGLSGLVRQHMRSGSTSSSAYTSRPNTEYFSSQVSSVAYGGKTLAELDDLNLWTTRRDGANANPNSSELSPDQLKMLAAQDVAHAGGTDDAEVDEFANQLADARRRVREKLTSFADTDSSRATSPVPPLPPAPSVESVKSSVPPSAIPLSMLKSKSSRGSLIERSRSIMGSTTKTKKILGIGPATINTPPSNQDVEEAGLETMREECHIESQPQLLGSSQEMSVEEAEQEDDTIIHPGLRAFRQARRELQRRKELEADARHLSPTSSPPVHEAHATSTVQSSPSRDHHPVPCSPSRGRRPPPVGQYRGSGEERRNNMGPVSPHAARSSAERPRGGSELNENSVRSQSRARSMRSRTDTDMYGEAHGTNSSQATLRSPAPSASDMRRSPLMSPSAYPGRNGISTAGYDTGSGQRTLSSLGLPPSPASHGSYRPTLAQMPSSDSLTTGTINDSMKRFVDKREISEPTFVTSTSRVPTVSLPHTRSIPDHTGSMRSRSRSRIRTQADGSTGPAPPLPPINPRRRQDGSRPRVHINTEPGPTHGDLDTVDSSAMPRSRSAAGTPELVQTPNRDDGNSQAEFRRRIQQINEAAANQTGRSLPPKSRDNSPSFIVRGPLASRVMAARKGQDRSELQGAMI